MWRVLDEHQAGRVQTHFFEPTDSPKSQALMRTIDGLNKRFGNGTLQFCSSGTEKSWMAQSNLRSPCYTTRWSDILTVR